MFPTSSIWEIYTYNFNILRIQYGCFLKWWYPQIITFNEFGIINHPFWGTPIFGNTHIFPINSLVRKIPCKKMVSPKPGVGHQKWVWKKKPRSSVTVLHEDAPSTGAGMTHVTNSPSKRYQTHIFQRVFSSFSPLPPTPNALTFSCYVRVVLWRLP